MPMRSPRALALFALIAVAAPGPALVPADRAVERPLTDVNRASLAAAITEAGRYLAAHRGASVTLRLPAGTIDLSKGQTADEAAIDVSDINACPGTLTIAGAGMDRTTVVKSSDGMGILGRRARCVTFAGMTLMQRRIEVSQGRVVATEPDAIVVDVPAGFPSPAALAAAPAGVSEKGFNRWWLKPYAMTPSGPQIVRDAAHIRWTGATPVAGHPNRYRLAVRAAQPLSVAPGGYVSIKAKSGGQTYRFVSGSDITFRDIRWVNDARGKFRAVDRVTIQGCVGTRPAPINGVAFFVATSGGGAQIGSPDTNTSGHLVENNRFEGLGDDPINFNHASGTIRNNRITDANRGILLVASPNVVLQNNILVRAPVVRKDMGNKERRRRDR